MTVLTDLTSQVITYLLAQAAANPALGAGTPPVVIIDGQPKTEDVLVLSGTGLDQRLWIGSGGYQQDGGLADAAVSQQKFAFLDQARTRDQDFDVQCAAEAVSGDTLAAARAGAFAVLRAVELLLRGSPGTNPASSGDASMGGLVYWSGVTGPIELSQEQSQDGPIALVKFHVSGFVRLTS